MDKNFDELIDEDDLYLFEYQKESPYAINNLSTHIESITFNHPKGFTIIEMDGSYPSDSSYKMQIQYYKGLQTFSYLNNDIKYLEELFTIFHLFDILPIYKLQHGVTKRDINGVKVEFNQEALNILKKDLMERITYQKSKIRSLDIRPVVINKDYGSYKGLGAGLDSSASRYRNSGRGYI